jgi:hypothetical protein
MRNLIAHILSSSLQNMFQAQPDLSLFVPQETQEREPNLSFHLANELWKYLFWLNCDFDVTKGGHYNQRPDIVFHRRGSNALNFLVVEVKRPTNPDGVQHDLSKIRNHWFEGTLQYDFGASVLIDVTARDFEIRLLARVCPEDLTPITQATLPQPLSPPKFNRVRRTRLVNLAQRTATAAAANRPADAVVLKRRLADSVRALYAPAN